MDDHKVGFAPSVADLIASRLCHDLVNPLGAIGNGVELLDMTGDANGPELDLVRDAVREAQARIRFLRIAFGACAQDQTVRARESRAAVEDLFRDSRMRVDWPGLGDRPRAEIKLAFLMLLCAETALPMGGDVQIGPEASGGWALRVMSERVRMDDDLWSVLRFGTTSMNRSLRPSEVQFPALHLAASEQGLTINFVQTDSGLEISTT